MKKPLMTIILILLIGGCSNEPINYETELVKKDSKYFVRGTNELFSGSVFSIYPITGLKQNEGVIKNGEMISRIRYTYSSETREIITITPYKDEKKDGLWKSYYSNGAKKAEQNWKNGQKDDEFTNWYESGSLKNKGFYKNGIKDESKSLEWYENGDVKDGDIQTAIKNIYIQTQQYYMARGEWPLDLVQLESVRKLDLDSSIKLKWKIELQLPEKLISTSTKEMRGGTGKVLSYDVSTRKFSGYGHQ
jgi:antitoxin component YwqK of YwqJK toxin-antitoxin module